ncbi:MAG: NAD(P)H-dependent oxidoreductase [Elusimicrobiota bacterium]
MFIIYAHPNREGHCGYFLKNIIKKLDNKDISYELLDLYREGFDPVLKPEEHYTSGHKEVSQRVKEIQDKIKDNDRLIFIYPTWWQNMPAILKGFLDRVFIPGFGFYYKGIFPKGLLKGKKAAIFTSTGAPRIFTKLFAADRSIKVLKKDLLKLCGIKAKAYVVPSARELNEKNKKKIEKLIDKGLKYL